VQYQFHKMKKIIFLLCLLVNSAILFAQTRDSLAFIEEMHRLNRFNDSLKNLQITKDSLSLEEIMSIQKATGNAGEEKESEAEKRFNGIMQRKDKEQHILRNRLLMILAFFLILIFLMRAILNKQTQRKKKY
jgi:uncharacterized membrane protein affecting hemolysin expression